MKGYLWWKPLFLLVKIKIHKKKYVSSGTRCNKPFLIQSETRVGVVKR